MKRKIKVMNKKGTYAILATILFSSVMILAAAVIHASGENAISSTADNFGPLWGRSILAEYDRNLKDRYGIFAYNGNKLQVEEKLKTYVSYSLEDKKYISFDSCECKLEEYRLEESENFFAQIKEAVAFDGKPIPIEKEVTGASNPVDAENSSDNRYIKNQRIIKALPSGGKEQGLGISAIADKISETKGMRDLIDESAEDLYLFRFYKDFMNDRELGETYFRNEIEYILTGKLDDEKAKKRVKTYLTLLRNALNLTYLYSCDEKRNAALAAAELIMPQAPVIAQALIMEGWAYMEARNDVKLLYAGKEVPLLKKDENWAISLENLLASEYGCDTEGNPVSSDDHNDEIKGCVLPQRVEGIAYEGYLRILVSSMPKEMKKLRMLDLIQINMKYLYCEYFLIRDYYTGLDYSIRINGKTHEFNEKYEKGKLYR